MRTSINSVSVQDTPHQQSSNRYGKEKSFHGVKTALFTLVSAAVLSGCLLEGDVSASKTRNELIAQLESNAASEGTGTTEREVGETGGTGSATTGGSSTGSSTSGSTSTSGGSSTSGSSGSTSGSGSVPTTGALTNPAAMSDHYPGTSNYSKTVNLPSCDGADALRISTAAGLSQINNSSYRVFCIAPGDYRSHGLLAISGTGGTESAPKVIRFESSEFADSDEIFTADLSKLARMPALDIRNTSHWVVNRLAWEGTSGMPIRMSGATDIVIDRIRLVNNSRGIEFQHGTNDSYLQNSYIGNQIIPQYSGNDGVCVAMIGHYRQVSLGGTINYDYPVVAKDNHIVNNEIFNCNDGFQIVWMPQYSNHADFQGTILAGNDIYIDNTRRTNCSGSLSWNGDCAYTENAMDFKAASLNGSNPVEVFDNRMWGWRKTDSTYNGPANSWGTAVSTHYSSMKNLHVYENVIWDVGAGVGFTRGSNNSVVRDNIIANVTGVGVNNGVAIMTYSDSYDYFNSTYAYGNVKNMTVERNHVINSDGAWLSTSAANSNFECNVVSNGSWTATSGDWSVGLSAGQNTYFGTNSGSLSQGSDAVHSAGTSNMGQLCFDTKKASISGGEEVCISGVLHTPSTPSVCASTYWTTANWSN